MEEGSGNRGGQRRELQGIHVQFMAKRPKGRIKVVVQADGGRITTRKFGKQEDVRWAGKLADVSSTSLIISIWRKPWYIYRRLVGRFRVAPADSRSLVTELTDEKGRLKLTLTFAGTGAGDEDSSVAPALGRPVETLGNDQLALSPAHPTTTDPVEEAKKSREETMARILDARPKVKDKKVILEKLGRARCLIGYIDTIGDVIGDAHPIAGAAFSVIGLFIKACENQEHCRDAALDLMDQLDAFMKIGGNVPELDARQGAVRPVQDMLRLIDDIVRYISQHTKGGYTGDLWSQEYLEKITAFKTDFSKAQSSFNAILQTEIFKGLDAMQQELKLEKLKPSVDAHFRSSKASLCLEDTRTNLLDKLRLWSETRIPSTSVAHSFSHLHWLHGAAGTGKSTVARTFARQEELRGSALVCFFCHRDIPDLSSATRLLPTLAYFLAKQHAGYARAIIKILNDPKYVSIATAEISEQFEVLFENILPTLTPPAGVFVGTVDAVDECGDAIEQGTIATHLWKLTTLVPWLKLFVTSRREPRISDALKSAGCTITNIEDEPSTRQDIRRYLVEGLSFLSISPAIIDALVDRAGGLFIWCNTLIKYLRTCADPEGVITQIVTLPSTSTDPDAPNGVSGVYADLYKLYGEILQRAVPNQIDEPIARRILGLVMITTETQPISCAAISSFLRAKVTTVETIVKWMHAVLYVDEDAQSGSRSHGRVRVYHNSFHDYLQFTLDPTEIVKLHAIMAERSLNTLSAELRFNICDLKGKPCLNTAVPNIAGIITEKISALLHYASLFWLHHLNRAGPPSKAMEDNVMGIVCGVRVLFYLEVLSFLDALERGAMMFFDCAHLFKHRPDILAASGDIERFISSYSEAMKSIPHIYISALAWAPADSSTIQRLMSYFTHLPLICDDNEVSWDPCIAVRTMGCPVLSVAYSPSGSHIALGLDDETLRITDSRTGAPVGEPLRGHSYSVVSVAYSVDGTRIASGSYDNTIRLWDAQSFMPLGEPFVGHTDCSRSLAFSLDGSRIASGSDDTTVRIWNTATGAQIGEPLLGHSEVVRSVAYSPDGKHVVSGSEDNTIRIWDAQSGAMVGKPLEGHTNWVFSVAYSPDGTRIVSSSNDGTVRIWDAHSGTPIGNPLKSGSSFVLSAVYSPQGSHIASSSGDGSVRLWDAMSGTLLGAPLQGHSSSVNSLAFSPDGLRLASGSSDGTVCIWNTSSRLKPRIATGHTQYSDSDTKGFNTATYSADGTRIISGSGDSLLRVWDARSGALIGEPFRGHSGAVTAVAISPDGTRIASGSRDATIRVWDAVSGVQIGSPFEGHTGSANGITYSPDGTRIVSGSDDKTIRIWDALSGKPIGDPWQAHSQTVESVAYSPDGRHIASASGDGTVRIWDAQSGAPICDPLTGHTKCVRAVAYSPDGTRIVSASEDETLRVWNPESGTSVGSPLQGHSLYVLSVTYSPDGSRIISGGADNTVRIWDASSGAPIGEPLQGHSFWVTSVTCSPDGSHILSAGHKTMRVWERSPPADEHWQTCLSSLDNQNGWAQDGEDLLLWVPHQYRERLRYRNTMVIGEGIKSRTPVIDVLKVWMYSGEKWTDLYTGSSK